MRPEDGLHQVADVFVAVFMKDENGRTGAAKGAAQKAGSTQASHILKTWDQGESIGLMHYGSR